MNAIRGTLIDGNGGWLSGIHTFGRWAPGRHAPTSTEIAKIPFSGYKWTLSVKTCLRGNRSALLRIYLHLAALHPHDLRHSSAEHYHVRFPAI